ncbi:heterokaryon incompatibility protein-domain-containing protein [Cladorrhinum sp. PSN259]|nr:heterokaryon incompatibility protein-domain-containing protein [Cladorrhinum sp. PSN259]
MANTAYEYSPIDLSTDAIRLIRLYRGYEDNHVRCEIFQTFLHKIEGVPYEALSYTWGSEDEYAEITVSDRKMTIRKNLYMALRHLMKPDEDQILWVDAICIDQKNDNEKGHQVGYMSQIYDKAEQVHIWLGPATENAELLMDLMIQLDKRVIERSDYRRDSPEAWFKEWPCLLEDMGVRDLNSDDQMKQLRDVLGDFLGNPWFQRVWIIQEVFNAKRAVIRCGRNTISTRTFVLIPWLMQVEIDSHIQAVLDIMPGYLRTTSWWRDKPSLRTLLVKFHESKATDRRDKIYALVGISSDTASRSILKQDAYRLTWGEVVQGTLQYLLFGQAPSGGLVLPPWSLMEFFHNLKMNQLPTATLDWALHARQDLTAAKILTTITAIDVNKGLLTIESPPLIFLARNIRGSSFGATVKAILSRNDVDVNIRDELGDNDTPLCIAARKGNRMMTVLLLSHPDIKLNQRELIQEQPSANTRQNILTPLYHAARNNFLDIARLLLDKGVDIEDENGKYGETALYIASKSGHAEIVELLLARGADFNTTNTRGISALWIASFHNNASIVQLLLARGADLTARAMFRYDEASEPKSLTPMGIAEHFEYRAVMELLHEAERQQATSRETVAEPQHEQILALDQRPESLWKRSRAKLRVAVHVLTKVSSKEQPSGSGQH